MSCGEKLPASYSQLPFFSLGFFFWCLFGLVFFFKQTKLVLGYMDVSFCIPAVFVGWVFFSYQNIIFLSGISISLKGHKGGDLALD